MRFFKKSVPKNSKLLGIPSFFGVFFSKKDLSKKSAGIGRMGKTRKNNGLVKKVSNIVTGAVKQVVKLGKYALNSTKRAFHSITKKAQMGGGRRRRRGGKRGSRRK
jgi:hypothetical protein